MGFLWMRWVQHGLCLRYDRPYGYSVRFIWINPYGTAHTQRTAVLPVTQIIVRITLVAGLPMPLLISWVTGLN